MYKYKSIIFLFVIIFHCAEGQSLRIYNLSDQSEITDSTLMLQSPDNNGWVGFESLDLYVKVVNTGFSNLEIGAKKIENDSLQPDVQHTICFAGTCYAPSVFISPNHITLLPGESDSGFVAHYLFDNRIHVRGLNNVTYVFYDVNNPSDSVFVNVIYNTVTITGIDEVSGSNSEVISFPNPVNQNVNFKLKDIESCTILNSQGANLKDISFGSDFNELSINTKDYPCGIYFYTFIDKNKRRYSGKFLIVR